MGKAKNAKGTKKEQSEKEILLSPSPSHPSPQRHPPFKIFLTYLLVMVLIIKDFKDPTALPITVESPTLGGLCEVDKPHFTDKEMKGKGPARGHTVREWSWDSNSSRLSPLPTPLGCLPQAHPVACPLGSLQGFTLSWTTKDLS